MAKIMSPPFVEKMGNRIIAYILNISENDAEKIAIQGVKLTKSQEDTLEAFITLCKDIRGKYIDHENIAPYMFYDLFSRFNNGEHIFNVWRKNNGGNVIKYEIDDHEKLLSTLNRIISKVYPLFLVHNNGWNWPSSMILSSMSRPVWQFPEFNSLLLAFMKDDSISSMFSCKKDIMETKGWYMSSAGHGGVIHLMDLPQRILINSFVLMRMREKFSLKSFTEAAKDTVNVIRQCACGKPVEIPSFLGFNNISIDDIGEVETAWGTIRPVDKGISELIPGHSAVTSFNDKQYQLGFALETTLPYQVNFMNQNEYDTGKWPKAMNDKQEKINIIKENISLCFSLACCRNPPFGVSLAWTMIFDPINHGIDAAWHPNRRSVMPFYIIKEDKERNELIRWCSLVKNIGDKNIRLAIRRVLSAINGRTNPVDSFIDTVIAWENLFGGHAELGFRISVSIANLLGNTTEFKKEDTQKKVNDYYNLRSKIVHGVKDMTNEEAVKCRDECLDITLKVIRKLYMERHDLIKEKESSARSKKLALSDDHAQGLEGAAT